MTWLQSPMADRPRMLPIAMSSYPWRNWSDAPSKMLLSRPEEIGLPLHASWALARPPSTASSKNTPAFPQTQTQSAPKEDIGMEYFLICTNPTCRFIVNLREGAQVLERSKLVLDECPECGHPWSSYCPFCARRL